MTNTEQQQLTALQAKQYLARGGVSCPFCGSLELDAQHYETDCQRAYQKVKCLSCGRVWHDGYTLDSVADDEAGEFIYADDAGEEGQPETAGPAGVVQFTPGPWHVQEDMDQYGYYRIEESAEEQEDWVNQGFEESDEEGDRRQQIVNVRSECNRLLIEAVPNFWEIVRLLADREDSDDPLIRDAQALVDKIESAAATLDGGDAQ